MTLSTLAGTKFTVSLSNRIVPAWGVTDIDFSNTYITVIRRQKENGTPVNETVADRLTLSPAANQTVTLPERDYPSGFYTVRLTVTAKASGKTETFDYLGEIIVDATKASESYGLSSSTQIISTDTAQSADSQNRRYYGRKMTVMPRKPLPVYGDAPAARNLSPRNASHCALIFTAHNKPVAGYATSRKKAIKVGGTLQVWIRRADAAKAGRRLVCREDPADIYPHMCAMKPIVDGASKCRQYRGNKLPLIKNTLKQVAIRVSNATGLMTEIHTSISIRWTRRFGYRSRHDTNGQYVGSKLTFTPEPGQLMTEHLLFQRLTSRRKPALSLVPTGIIPYPKPTAITFIGSIL
jgi:hypothetical protein